MINFLYTLFFHRQIIRVLREEPKKSLEVQLFEFKAAMGCFDVKMNSPIVTLMGRAMIELLRSVEGAENYLMLPFEEKATGEVFEITIQRKKGKTPGEVESEMQGKVELFEQMRLMLNQAVDNGGMANEVPLRLFLKRNNLRSFRSRT